MDSAQQAKAPKPMNISDIVVTKDDIAAARTRNKQKRREDLANWTPNESTSYREIEFQLRSGHAMRVFHLGLVHAQVSLYKFYEALPNNNESVRAAEAAINAKFSAIEAKLNENLTRVKEVAKAVMADDVSGFTTPQTFRVRMLTPEALRFGQLLQKYDDLNELCHALFWAGKMNRNHKRDIGTEFRNLLLRFARELHVLYMQAKRSVWNNRRERERARILKEKRKAYTAQMAREASHEEATVVVSIGDEVPVAAASSKPKAKRTRKANGAETPVEAAA